MGEISSQLFVEHILQLLIQSRILAKILLFPAAFRNNVNFLTSMEANHFDAIVSELFVRLDQKIIAILKLLILIILKMDSVLLKQVLIQVRILHLKIFSVHLATTPELRTLLDEDIIVSLKIHGPIL